MKKSVCRWLDANEWGGLHLEDNLVSACCTRSVPLIEGRFDTIDINKLITARKELFKKINSKEHTLCDGCNLLFSKEESEINLDKIKCLVILPFTTCNFRCDYCYLSKEQLSAKLDVKDKKVSEIVKNLNQCNFLDKNIEICLGGGEPTLLEDIPELLQYLSENFDNPTFKLLSNSSITKKVSEIIPHLKLYNNINKILYTSIDSGCSSTFKIIRGADKFDDVVSNLVSYAKENVFNEITLKYIFMENEQNIAFKDISGFAKICKKVMSITSSKVDFVLDADVRDKRLQNTNLEENVIQAAGKLYYYLTEILHLEPCWYGGRLSDRSKEGLDDIERIKNYARIYEQMKKNREEKLFIKSLKDLSNYTFIQRIFSVKNVYKHKVITIFGVKIKIRRICE